MNKRMVVCAAVVAAIIAPTSAFAAKGGSHGGGGGGGGGGATGPYSLVFNYCDGSAGANGFTTGTSVDGGAKAVTVDGANCVDGAPNHGGVNNNAASISLWNFWDDGTNNTLRLDQVPALKMSVQGPFTQGGSPRISVLMNDSGVLFLDPTACGTPNAKGWVTADFVNAPVCSINDGTTYYDNWADLVQSGDHPDGIYFAYVIADQPTVNRVDRIVLGSQVFSS